MRNFKDLSRALASIAGGLKSIKDIIDTIEPGGGGASSDYSTTPHVVGKWVDGETDVYELTVTGTTAGSGDTNVDLSSVLPDGYLMDLLISADGALTRGSGFNQEYAFPGVGIEVSINDTGLRLGPSNNAGFHSAAFRATIRFTLKASA